MGSLTDTLGIDIAGRLRSHFLANLPTQSYAWLNGAASLSSLASMSPLGALAAGLPTSASSPTGVAAAQATQARRGSTGSTGAVDKKNPMGGIRYLLGVFLCLTYD